MKYEFEFEITKALLRKATIGYILHMVGGALIAVLIVFIILVCFIINGSANNLSYIVVGASGVIILYYIFIYLRSGVMLDKMPDRKVKVCLDEEAMTFSSSESQSLYKWSRIKKILKLKDIVIIFLHGTNLLMTPIPISSMTNEAREFLFHKINNS